MASSVIGTRIRRVHSFFIERMNRSITEMLPCCWTAPKRGLMPRRWHQFRAGAGCREGCRSRRPRPESYEVFGTDKGLDRLLT